MIVKLNFSTPVSRISRQKSEGTDDDRKEKSWNHYFSRISDVSLLSEVSSNRWIFVEASRPRPRDLLLRWSFHRIMMGSWPRSSSVRNIILPFRYLRMIPSHQMFVATCWIVARRMLTTRLLLVALSGWLNPVGIKKFTIN